MTLFKPGDRVVYHRHDLFYNGSEGTVVSANVVGVKVEWDKTSRVGRWAREYYGNFVHSVSSSNLLLLQREYEYVSTQEGDRDDDI